MYQIIKLYTLNLYDVIHQSYLNKASVGKSYAMNREKKYKYNKPILESSLYAFSGIKYLRRDNLFKLD